MKKTSRNRFRLDAADLIELFHFPVEFRGEVLTERAGGKWLGGRGMNFSQYKPAIAHIFLGIDLTGLGVGNADPFVGVNGQRFHAGNFPRYEGGVKADWYIYDLGYPIYEASVRLGVL